MKKIYKMLTAVLLSATILSGSCVISQACDGGPCVIEENAPEPEMYVLPCDYEIDLLALVTMAEAEGECELGKRLVIDTVLNRVDSPYFPNTITGVIYQPNQFTSMWNGRVNRCYVREDIRQLVIKECISRTNYETVFFMAGWYSYYGTPLFRVGNHYFSKY